MKNEEQLKIESEIKKINGIINLLQVRVSELEAQLSGDKPLAYGVVDSYEYALETFGSEISKDYAEHKRLVTCMNNLCKARQVRSDNKNSLQARAISFMLRGDSANTIANKLNINCRTIYNYFSSLTVTKFYELYENYNEVFADVSQELILLFVMCNCNSREYRYMLKQINY